MTTMSPEQQSLKDVPRRREPSSALHLSTWGQTGEQGALRGQVSPLELRVSQVG